ncbi:MAG TPA: nucleotide exchange factor GrpE [Catalimonadaceae bacterium]|nr:nucleotide exchange factor GrpE [Catalimonadaceae bacterium]
MNKGENTIEDKEMIQDDTAVNQEVEENGTSVESENKVESELDKLKNEAADWKDKYIRLYAEFENFRQRTSKEKLALISTATEGLMIEILPVIDDFERSMKAMETASEINSLREGVELVYHKLLKTLNQKGLKPMESIGKPFDAEFQEAITQIPAADPTQKGNVIDEVEKGYTLNDKTIRFAKVVIGS